MAHASASGSGPGSQERSDAPRGRGAPPGRGRPALLLLLAVLSLVLCAGTAIWTVALLGGLLYARAVDSPSAGILSVSLVAAVNALSVPLLAVGAVGLLRRARWGIFATWAYSLLGLGQALFLLATGASLLLVTALAVFPAATLLLSCSPGTRRACGLPERSLFW